jgi:hypothetical protein
MQSADRLRGYPEWDPDLRDELDGFLENLTENCQRARLAMSEIDAALQDPRWRLLDKSP